MVGTTGETGPDGTEQALSILPQRMAGDVVVATAQHSRSQETITVAADAIQDGTEQEQNGQQEDAAATVLLGHQINAAADVTKQSVFK